MKTENTRSIFRMAREIPAPAKEVTKALNELGYLEKDPSKQRQYTLSDKGRLHGHFISVSHPVFDENVYEEVKKHISDHSKESMEETLLVEEKLVGKEEKSSDHFKKYGYKKIAKERSPWLMSFYTCINEEDILKTAEELGFVKKEKDLFIPTEKGLSSGIREERSIYFDENVQKAILDKLNMTDWYDDEE